MRRPKLSMSIDVHKYKQIFAQFLMNLNYSSCKDALLCYKTLICELCQISHELISSPL